MCSLAVLIFDSFPLFVCNYVKPCYSKTTNLINPSKGDDRALLVTESVWQAMFGMVCGVKTEKNY